MSTQIYVLSLADDKWYVGKTDNIMKRFQEHVSGDGSAWTAKYKPIKIEEVVPGDNFDEDKITKKYMGKYGIDNVRGGSYVTLELSKVQKKYLENEIKMSTDKCVLCGDIGHFIKNCPKNNTDSAKTAENDIKCNRCKRVGHYANACYAKTDVDGHYIKVKSDKKADCKKYGVNDHGEKTCTKLIDQSCTRCGRTNHVIENCYTKKDVNGRTLFEKGSERTCSRCNNIIYHTDQCDCPMTSLKQIFSVVGDAFRYATNNEKGAIDKGW